MHGAWRVFGVSTHSRPKAAGYRNCTTADTRSCFNTQPPEGGWKLASVSGLNSTRFQHTAARRRLVKTRYDLWSVCMFQHTAARRRLEPLTMLWSRVNMFQHTAARRRLEKILDKHHPGWEFQHTAARRRLDRWISDESYQTAFQHTAARRRLGQLPEVQANVLLFQHTAARRRLVSENFASNSTVSVSTHSRPKAAGCRDIPTTCRRWFQHTAARRRLGFQSLS